MSVAAPPAVNARSAAALHARLQEGTRAARATVTDRGGRPATRRRPVSDGDVWQVLSHLQLTGGIVEPMLSRDRALRRLVSLLLHESTPAQEPVPLPAVTAPVLVVRSGPWPVLRGLLTRLAASTAPPAVTVLCHRQDAAALDELRPSFQFDLEPLFYPRFGPFHPDTLVRLIDAGPGHWTTTFVLDGSRTGAGQALEHLTTRLASRHSELYVWNASGALFRQRSLRETLGRERYDLVRRLLRWRASQPASD
jgi:hypothetical protein